MLHRQVYVVLAVLLAVLIVRVASSATTVEESSKSNPSSLLRSDSSGKSEIKDHYPLAWVEIPYKNVIDNDRLFLKFKTCLLAEQPKGCPQVAMDIIRLAPEVIATQCAKCLPAHIERMKEIANYLCLTRKADFDEIRRVRDPDGAIQSGFEERFGKINC